MQGAVRFGLFIAVVTLIVTGFYANGLRNTIADQEARIASVTAELNSEKAQTGALRKQGADNEAALKEAQAKITDLQSQLEVAKTPVRRRR